MKINWFAPLPPTPSAVALHNAAVLPVLARKASIRVWIHESECDPDLAAQLDVRHYNPSDMPWADINAAAISIYHIGNHAEFHGPILEVARQHPGIVILHDLKLQHLLAGMVVRTHTLEREEYLEMMEYHHSERAREAGEALLVQQRSADDVCEEFPLTGAVLENAIGVAVHTGNGHAQLAKCAGIPVAHLPLPALPPDRRWSRPEAGPQTAEFSRDEPYRIIVFGFLGPNRRLVPILRALTEFQHKHRFHLHVYGTLPDREEIAHLIEELSLQAVVTLHGYVPDPELQEALARSHLALNLRYPTMGEASATQLLLWQHGVPTIVTETGWYATLPEAAVAKVRPAAEEEDIQSHLREFLFSPETFRKMGQAGQRYVEQHHTVEAYLTALMELINATLEVAPREAAYRLAQRAGERMRPWFAEEAIGMLPHLAQAISDLCDPRPGPRRKKRAWLSTAR